MNSQQGDIQKYRLYYKVIQQPKKPQLILIQPAMVPFIFHFSQKALCICRLNPKLAQSFPLSMQIFQTLKNRIIPKRKSSRTGRTPTRMKYQEKIKFVMRNIECKLAQMQKRPPQKMIKFNFQEQRQFFQRQDVQDHFKLQMPIIIQQKQESNDIKIRQFEELIFGILQSAQKSIALAKKQLEYSIKQRQLPWSIEMFKDIEIFAESVFNQFTNINLKAHDQHQKKIYEQQQEQQNQITPEFKLQNQEFDLNKVEQQN